MEPRHQISDDGYKLALFERLRNGYIQFSQFLSGDLQPEKPEGRVSVTFRVHGNKTCQQYTAPATEGSKPGVWKRFGQTAADLAV